MEAIRPMPAVFDRRYVKKLDGPNVKKAATKWDLAQMVIEDIQRFKAEQKCDRLVMVWCGSTEIYMPEGPVHAALEALEAGLKNNDPDIPSSMIYAYAAIKLGIPYANGAPNLCADTIALEEMAKANKTPICGKDFKTGQTLMKTIIAPGLKARMLGVSGWFSANILGNRDGEVLDDPESFMTKEISKLGVLEHILRPDLNAELYGNLYQRSASTTIRRAATTRKGGTTSTSSAGWATRCRSRSTSSAGTASWPRPSSSTWSCCWTWPAAAACTASRSGSRSSSRARTTSAASTPSTTCSFRR